MVVLYGRDAKEVYDSMLLRDVVIDAKGVFEYFDMGGAMFRAFRTIGGEMFKNDFGTFNEAVTWLNNEGD